MIDHETQIIDEWLEPVDRLALAYAPKPGRTLWLGFLALDRRLERSAVPGAEPVLAQIKLAWWRDRFAESSLGWPKGEPLLAVLRAWEPERAALQELVDGWEAREIGEDGGIRLRAARVEALLALARLAGGGGALQDIRRAAAEWHDRERSGPAPRLPRTMRPLAVLRGMAVRGEGTGPLASFAAALRIGLIGR